MVRRRPSSGRPIPIRMHSVVRVVAWSDPCCRTTARLGTPGDDRMIEGAAVETLESRMAVCMPITSLPILPKPTMKVGRRLRFETPLGRRGHCTCSIKPRETAAYRGLVHPTLNGDPRRQSAPESTLTPTSASAAISTTMHSTARLNLSLLPFVELALCVNLLA